VNLISSLMLLLYENCTMTITMSMSILILSSGYY